MDNLEDIKKSKMEGINSIFDMLLEGAKEGLDKSLVTRDELLTEAEKLLEITCNAYLGDMKVSQLNSWTTDELAKKSLMNCFTKALKG